jgi:hypothetical protein
LDRPNGRDDKARVPFRRSRSFSEHIVFVDITCDLADEKEFIRERLLDLNKA